MKIRIKDNEYDVLVKYSNFLKIYEVDIVAPNWARMGNVKFKIGTKTGSNRTWLHNISTEPEYQHMGIGTALLKICEYMTSLNDISVIHGRYFPFNEHAKPMYEKNGYEIIRYSEQESFLVKKLDIAKTLREMAEIIIDDSALTDTLG